MAELRDLIEKAKKVQMSDADKEAQRRSFAYGNANIENKRVTRHVIEIAAERVSKKSG
ncbi:MAG: hypothetical protein JWN69_945 [Alphaproteobacteria bacterium]|nr:hypothetical protein [Alphaproteobacteria bacterium]